MKGVLGTMSDKMPRTDSTQAMKSIFSAYGGEEEGAVEGEAGTPPPPGGVPGDLMDDNISGSDDEGSTTRWGN